MEFLDLIPEVVFEIEKDLTLRFINSSSEKITGYKKEELTGRKINLEDYFAPEDIPKMRKNFDENFKGNHISGNHYRMLNKDGQEIILKIHNYPIIENGEIVALRCLAVNITEQENKIHTLTGKEYHYRQIFLNSPIAYQSLNNEGIIIDVNPAWEDATGYRHEEIVGKPFRSILPEPYKVKFEKSYILFKETGEARDVEFKLQKKDGITIEVNYNGKAEFAEDGTFLRSHCVFNDITSQKQAEETLKNSEKRFRELNATKDKFFSIIAHDLKNPFNDLIGFSQLLATNIHKYDLQKIEQFVQIIHQSSKLAYGLLENLLEWSRTQTGTLKYKPELIDLQKIVQENIDLLSSNAQHKNIKIITEINENTIIYADQNMLHTIIRNLLSNAIKYTRDGGYVKLTHKIFPDYIETFIEDSGIGIDQKNIMKLFRIDENYTSPGTQREKGTGLGLILCKEFVEKNGGKIKVKSKPGKGSIFSFTIPSKKAKIS
ncbi:MAG: PAS domain-containing sensor histidine kinase [Bacteroidales bacterium]|jgi:PAS domain S-box-containing protein|nr:PAS domain-containing sensor histidine kinase [Bacteroidales bacterium]